MSRPRVGSRIKIISYKHDGMVHRIWKSNLVLHVTSSMVIIGNDQTEVLESDGRTWITREPAITYFYKDSWFNIICMIRESGIFYYCNISSPFVFEEGLLKYIDYDLDVKVFPDFTHKILDEDEYLVHQDRMKYPKELDHILYKNIDDLVLMVHERKGPFAHGTIGDWYERFLTYRNY